MKVDQISLLVYALNSIACLIALDILVSVETYEDCFVLKLPRFDWRDEVFNELGAWVGILFSLLVENPILLVKGVVGSNINLLVFAYSISGQDDELFVDLSM